MITRRSFVTACTAALGALSAAPPARAFAQSPVMRLRPGGSGDGFDPWLEVIAPAFRHNAAEVARIAGGRPILAVVKNNAYGLGDVLVGPLLASCPEVGGIACVRPAEALAMRSAGVRKPMLTMAELGEEESAELVRRDVMLSAWLDDAPERLARIARRARRRVPVHLYLDTGMNREGQPIGRAMPWVERIAGLREVRIDGTYQMFVHDVDFDRVQLARFLAFTRAAAGRTLRLGRLHAAATFELHRVPESHLDMVRVGNALFGAQPGAGVAHAADLRPVVRLKARVVRVERVEPGESAGFNRAFQPSAPTRVALLPVGHTDGYPSAAAGTCQVLINGRLFPVVTGGVNSAHTIVDVGLDANVSVGDTATLVGPEAPEILPAEVGARTKLGFYQLITKFNALLPRTLVEA
ncbi:MAG: alanine racemase [Acidobacteriota bacterium]